VKDYIIAYEKVILQDPRGMYRFEVLQEGNVVKCVQDIRFMVHARLSVSGEDSERLQYSMAAEPVPTTDWGWELQ
jgi:hypothetical protein